jgi:hypothetical protein
MKILLMSVMLASTLSLTFTAPAFSGWGIWQTNGGVCALFEDGKKKEPEYAKQVEQTHATYKDALMRLQQLFKDKTCSPKPAS